MPVVWYTPSMTRRRIATAVASLLMVLSASVFGFGPGAVTPAGAAQYPLGDGYWLAAVDGGIFAFGDAQFFGSTGNLRLNRPIVGAAAHPFYEGYWLVATDGGIFNFGSAGFFGSTGDIRLTKPIVGMAPTPTGYGYWLVASDGGIFAFGDAEFFGSTGDIKLNQPIVGMAATPSGNGYWLVATDGGVFGFGDAAFQGSTGNIKLNKPVVGMSPTPSGKGYYMVASDGGIFNFGDAEFRGSRGGSPLNAPIVGMATSRTGGGYQLVATDGGIFNYGDSQFFGSTGDIRLNQPILGMALRPRLALTVDAFADAPGRSSNWVDVGGDWRLRLSHNGTGTPAGARLYGIEGLEVSQLGTMSVVFDAGNCATGRTAFNVSYDTTGDLAADATRTLACTGAGTTFSVNPVDAGVPANATVTALDLLYTDGTVDLDNITVAGLTVTDYQVVRA